MTLDPMDQILVDYGDHHAIIEDRERSKDNDLLYFTDLGSLFDDAPVALDRMVEQMRDTLEVVCHCAKGNWSWYLDDETIADDNSIMQDVRKRLYISFDLSGDAMLSKMTLQELKGIKHAQGRGLSREAG